MTNWLAAPSYNNYHLTIQFVLDALAQDIPTSCMIFDNGSSDGTVQRLAEDIPDPRLFVISSPTNIGVGPAWNQICALLFGGVIDSAEHVLLCNTDIRLRHDTYRNLLIPKGGFVTPINVGDWEKCQKAGYLVEEEPAIKGGPDFSCFLIYRTFYHALGGFTEKYYPGWFEDNEAHWVAKCKGLGDQIFSVTFPYYHMGSQTLKNNPEIQQLNSTAFEKNKQIYINTWGGLPGHETIHLPECNGEHR